eukprot:1958251-Alexandrium_andersonii.AAC.1
MIGTSVQVMQQQEARLQEVERRSRNTADAVTVADRRARGASAAAAYATSEAIRLQDFEASRQAVVTQWPPSGPVEVRHQYVH